MAWSPRTSAPAYGSSPYAWDSSSLYECTWYAYYRVQEEGYTKPCWRTGSGSSGSEGFNTAKTWLSHWRDPWTVQDTSYIPVPGDIIVFDGSAGHVAVVETKSDNNNYTVSDYNLESYHGFGYRSWTRGSTIHTSYASTGAVLGYLHYGSTPGPTPGPTPPPSPISYQIINFDQTAYITENITGKLTDTSLTKKYFMRDNSESSYVEFTPTISGSNFSYALGDSFEKKIPNSTSGIVYIKVEAHDYWNDPGGVYSGDYIKWRQEVPITYKVPETYRPSIEYSNLKKNNLYNNNLVAGYSDISVDYLVKSSAPTGYKNSAEIEDKTEFKSFKGEVSVLGDELSGTISLLTIKEDSNYSVYITGSATDSRNRTTSGIETDHLLVYRYLTPSVIINSFFKCDKDGNLDPDGTYLRSNFDIDLSLVELGNSIKVEDIYVNIGEESYSNKVFKNEDGSYEFFIGEFDPSTEYSPTLTLHDDVMSVFGIPPITTAGLSASMIPFSLLDDGENNVGAAFGMEALERNAVEFAPNIRLKATNMSTGETIIKPAYEVLNNQPKIKILDFYPVGALYLSTNSINPSELFGGEWKQIKDTFLLAAGDIHSGGSTGGSETSSHTLTINEMPAHTHEVWRGASVSYGSSEAAHSVANDNDNFVQSGSTGGGQPFTVDIMPPYLAVYVFERIA